MTSTFNLDLSNLGISSLFGSNKQSQTQILCKKIEIVTSPHIAEPQWDIIMDICDALNADAGRARRVLAHLKRVLEKAMSISSDNLQLKNCLLVIDSLTRNGNDNVLSVVHSSFLSVLSKFALSEDNESTKLKSLLQSSENTKTCRDRVLELLLDWQSNESNIDQLKYPQFRGVFLELKQNGAPFDKIITERERIRKQQEIEAKNRRIQQEQEQQQGAEEKREDNDVQFEDVVKFDNPWSNKNMQFGRWYKSKLKADLNKLIDLICMTQDILAMKNVNDAQLMCIELREANKRLITIMLRTEDPPAIDCLLQLVTINSSLLDCYKKLVNGHKFVIPGVSRQFLHLITKCL
mmetsp:Transcript_61040/g.97078  ORF Transcript_61040/g.97078 Transcript_61040/m.97078 type:complete len:350 (+) Transcript_61040:23-1072(+)